ncbi:hypothetical protein B0H10DRAFT_381358 [Mycena sp. CBHHK59/15]|nr:hypothetical protein B0H10DRAFT_381358 [Mycena sp. CBHHK59/15]
MPPDTRPTLPQELVDLILDFTDNTTLKACSRVARSFLYTSQMHIFSEIKLLPSQWFDFGKNSMTLPRFSRILSRSPHIALYVRSLTVVEGDGVISIPWIRKDVLPAVLSMLVNLKGFSMQSPRLLDWVSLPMTLKNSLQVIHGSSLARIQLHKIRFDRSGGLISLLLGCRNLKSIKFQSVVVTTIDAQDPRIPDEHRLHLDSLELEPSLPLVHSLLTSVDLRSLQHLYVFVSAPVSEPETQRILDGVETLVHCHLRLSHHHTDTSLIDIHKLRHLRTLELSMYFDFEYAPDGYDPVEWASNILDSVDKSNQIQTVTLNLNIEEFDPPYLGRLADLERFLVRPEMASLRTVKVNLDSYSVDFNIYGGGREIREAFPILIERQMLEIELLGVT